MKISKLFHWLYASVMLLPIFAIGVTCGYAMFNKNAFESYTKKEFYTISALTDFQVDNEYQYLGSSAIYGQITEPSSSIFCYDVTLNGVHYDNVQFGYYSPNNTTEIRLYLKDLNTNNQVISNGVLNNYSFTFRYLRNTYNQVSFDLTKDLYRGIQYKTLDNAFYYAIDKVQSMPIFSWAYDSFLVAPFSYIVALFGISTNHVVVELLSYWLSISIIWLVFDLIMYVPLLVHRWIDKGVLE